MFLRAMRSGRSPLIATFATGDRFDASTDRSEIWKRKTKMSRREARGRGPEAEAEVEAEAEAEAEPEPEVEAEDVAEDVAEQAWRGPRR